MLVEYIPAEGEALQYIIDNLREADQREVMLSHGHTGEEAVINSVKASRYCAIAKIDGDVCAVFGVAKAGLMSTRGAPWMLGTNNLVKHKAVFLKHTREVIDDMLRVSPELTNYVHIENRLSVAWLKWIGFTLDKPSLYGVGQGLFSRFHMRKVSNV